MSVTKYLAMHARCAACQVDMEKSERMTIATQKEASSLATDPSEAKPTNLKQELASG